MFLLPERCSEASIESSSFLLGVPKCGTTTCGEPRSGVEKMNVPFSQSLSSFIEIVVQQVMRMIIRTKRKVGGGGGGGGQLYFPKVLYNSSQVASNNTAYLYERSPYSS